MTRHLCLLLCLLAGLLQPAAAHAAASFLMTDMAGKQHRLQDYRGKWVLVNYWATWCPPCLEEVPDLVNLYDQRKDQDLMILGVVFDYASVAAVSRYVDDMLMSYPIVLGNDSIAAQIGSAQVLPSSFLYDPQGRLVKVRHGKISRQEIEQLIARPR